MQLHSLLTLAALLACALPAQNTPCEILVNGDFETGDLSGWQEFPSAPGNITITSPGRNSRFAANIDNRVAPSASLIKNANVGVGVVVPGETITISFEARGVTAAGGVVFAELFSELAGGGVSASVILGGGPLGLDPDPNTWTSFRFTTMAGPDVSGGITLQLAAITGAVSGSTSNVTVDNVVLSVDRPAAAWSNYGTGWPGTNGVPGLTLDANPVLGQTVNLLLGNASGGDAAGGLLFGARQASLATPFGGTLLVDPVVAETLAPVAAGGGSYSLQLPADPALCGATLYAQFVHADPGASAGVAFTPGARITLGY